MKAVLLAGGLGTRLREETEFRPKPMVEIGGRPILWHIMKLYGAHGVRDFVVCVGYKGEMIKDYFLNYEARNNDFTITLGASASVEFHGAHEESHWKVTIADTGQQTLTGGRIKRIEPYIGRSRFLCTYGDSVADLNVSAVISFHERHGLLATMTVVSPVSRFGVVDVDPDGAVRAFREKPRGDGLVNAGFFVFEPEVFAYLDRDSALEEQPLARLARDGQLAAFRHDGFWQPMDTYREAMMLNAMWDAGEAPWRVWA